MFGYVVANKEQLSAEQKALYQRYYCGLCRSLKRNFGTVGRLTLNYDMAFLTLLLADLYDPATVVEDFRCAVHPGKARSAAANEILDYGAAMNVLLAYYNLMDDWEDEQKRTALGAARRLERFLPEIEARYPRQAAAVRQGMAALAAEEAHPPRDPDTAANLFGKELGELFVYRNDHWARDCRAFGEALGRFVYWMDAFEDLPKDRERGGYNPLLPLADRADCAERVHEMLKNALGECALILERLPLVEHLDVLRNVLYSGVWSKYELLKGERK